MRTRLFLRRQFRASAAILAVLGAVVAAMSFLAVATPRQLASSYDSALSKAMQDATDAERDLTVTATTMTFRGDPREEIAMFNRVIPDAVRDQTGADLASVLTTGVGAAQSKDFDVVDIASGQPMSEKPVTLALRLQENLDKNIDVSSGTFPEGISLIDIPEPIKDYYPEDVRDSIQIPVLDIALSRDTATALGLDVGRRLVLLPTLANRTYAPVVVKVTGIYEPRDVRNPFWMVERRMLSAMPVPTPDGGTGLSAVGLIAPAAHDSLIQVVRFETLAYSWRYAVDTSALRADRVTSLLADLRRIERIQTPREAGTFLVQSRSGLVDLLSRYEGQKHATESVVSVAVATVFAVAAAALALTARVFIDRRRSAIILARARGASARQVVTLLTWQAAQIVVPCAAAGAAAGLLVGSRGSAASWQLAACVAIAPLGLVGLIAYIEQRKVAIVAARKELLKPGLRRTALELLLVVIAVSSAFLVNRRQDVAPAGNGLDPFLVAAPALIGLAAGVVALRLHRYPLLLLAEFASRRRGAVGLIGLASGARSRIATALPVLVLVLSLALSLFAAAVQGSLDRGQSESAWRSLGADAVVSGAGLTPEVVEALAHTTGVTGVLPGYRDDKARLVVGGRNAEPITVVAVDPQRYEQLLASTPARFSLKRPSQELRDVYPLWATRQLPTTTRTEPTVNLATSGVTVRGQQVGVVGGLLDSSAARTIVLISDEAVRAVPGAPQDPNAVLVFGRGVSRSALAAAVPVDTDILTLSKVREDIRDAPLSHATRTAFLAAVSVSAALCVLAVLLWLIVTAPSRNTALSLLRTLGLSGKDARRIVVLEMAPAAVVALAAGVAVGLNLPWLLQSAIDLTPFVGGSGSATLAVDTVASALFIAAFVCLVAMSVAVATAFSRRLRLGTVLRLGEDN
jgi:putative ABC transport system permease protein